MKLGSKGGFREMPPKSKTVVGGSGQGWCERGDSNPHGLTRQILSLVRLPIPPLSQRSNYTGVVYGGWHGWLP